MHEKQMLMYLLDHLASRPVFPKIYDGFREIDELSKGEDALLHIMQDCVRLIADDKLIGLANETKLADWEVELGLSGQGLTLDERRAQMTDYLGRSRIINDAALLALARNAAGNDDIEITTDCDRMTCSIHKSNTEDAEEAEELRRAIVAVRPAMPQNLSLSAQVHADLSHTMTFNHGILTALHGNLGTIIAPEPPPFTVTIGLDNSVPPNTTSLRSEYYWMYQFAGGSSLSNLWNPAYYAETLLPNSATVMSTIPSSAFLDVEIWDGTAMIPLAGGSIQYRLDIYQNQPEFYTDSESTVTGTNCGVIMAMQSDAQVFSQSDFALPSDLYTISGTSVTWNISHPLYQLLNGKTAICSRS